MKQSANVIVSTKAIDGLNEFARKSESIAIPRILDEYAKDISNEYSRRVKHRVDERRISQKRNMANLNKRKKKNRSDSLVFSLLKKYERKQKISRLFRVSSPSARKRIIELPRDRMRIIGYLREKSYRLYQDTLSKIKGQPLPKYKAKLISEHMHRAIRDIGNG